MKTPERNLTLLTDFYQLTMMNGYLKHQRDEEIAVFDVFFRQNDMITYSLACGLEQVVEYILNLNFGEEEIEYLKSLNVFSQEFLDYIAKFKETTLPRIMELFERYKDEKQFIILKSYAEIDEFYNNLKNGFEKQ